MKFKPLGDSALLVSFGEVIYEEVNDRIHSLAKAIEKAGFEWLMEVVPAYSSLLVVYDPIKTSYTQVEDAVKSFLDAGIESFEGRLVEVPVVYGGKYGPDIEFVAEHNGLTVDDIIEIHSRPVYRVYFLGFLPGFAYLGGMDERIATPRLERPRIKVPAGSVGIAGKQTGIYPLESPGGWRLIGRTPLRLFDPSKEPPTLLRPGDRVRFVPVDEDEFRELYEREWGERND
ncbi:5-oxoprolinase subunit PxpB [Thermococcus thioreducens]|uniref:Allophanate hydrolase n=1 Tax=Thermococcus thioreducens TaxID=277988 RepID=A0A0Q2S3N8_9EURY|nr:5-oxoprolinase subunit PxpB [Thermococcus thioreducens]ASJ12893.1 allophanate hydrolase [Thermococcus thioreducens]KQH82083.1 allophanate hydrolase [Thermococcus thioreducens]SEV83740.1 sensor histidine kinase inhibitor, KipI family [Thermococcus thioreducens]